MTGKTLIALAAAALAMSAEASDRRSDYVYRYNLVAPESPVDNQVRQIKPHTAADTARSASELVELVEMENLELEPDPNASGNAVRLAAIRDTALTAGINRGLDWRSGQIRQMLEEQDTHLSRVYNFQRLLLSGMVMPPVIDSAEKLHRKVDENTATATGLQYVLAADARMVTEAPNWRDFLIKEFSPAPPIPAVALPKNKAEKRVWVEAVNAGWDIGIEHADALFDANLNLLTKTYRGMLTYMKLEAEGIVSMPQLSSAELGVVRDGRTLNIDDRIYRITAPAEFGAPDQWQVIPR